MPTTEPSQRAGLGRDHPYLLQQLQNVSAQPVLDYFTLFDPEHVHARILDTLGTPRPSGCVAGCLLASKQP
jgi:ABC-type cobalamin transport system ATPase subunit